MALDLKELLDPRHTAVLTMELQRGVVGDLASLPTLRAAVETAAVIPNTARLLGAARAVGARVVHCTAVFRSDGAGSPVNTPFASASRNSPTRGPGRPARETAAEPRSSAHPPILVIGSPEVALVPELGPEASDLESSRMHGMAPFIGTNLDSMLRAEGIRTVVATGVSLNVGIFGLVVEAVNYGYRVVVATDCVTGVPADYAAAVLKNSLTLLATLRTSQQIMALWGK